MTRRGWVLFVAMSVIWGIPYLFIKIAVGELDPATLVFLRTGLAALILLPIAIARGRVRAALPYWRVILFYTLVEVAGPWVLLFHAETRLSSSLAGLLVAGVPLVNALLSRLTGGADRLDVRRVIGLVIGLAGVAVLVGLDVSTDDYVAVGELGLVVLGYAIGALLISRELRQVPSEGVIALSVAVTALLFMPYGLTHLPTAPLSSGASLSLVVLGVVCTAVAFQVFFALIAEVGSTRATVITYFNPAVALVLGVALLGEPLTIGIVSGFALILAGSLLATRRVRTPAPTPA
ncbi:MAG: DMT family transporter [Chloroflexi bacterium]|nr:DMT family transporter [Chloroflexota bacterium]